MQGFIQDFLLGGGDITPVSITITFKNFFLAEEGDLVLGGTSQGTPLALYIVM